MENDSSGYGWFVYGMLIATVVLTIAHVVIRVDVPLTVIENSIKMCENNEGVDVLLASSSLLPKVKCNNGAVIPVKVD